MRLLFDQNVSPALVERLAEVFPDSVHVSTGGLDRAFDRAIWEHAREQGLIIVTKDADFGALGAKRPSTLGVK